MVAEGANVKQDGYFKIVMLRVFPSIVVGSFVHFELYGVAAVVALSTILGHIADVSRQKWDDD
jgi:hypothetical protein